MMSRNSILQRNANDRNANDYLPQNCSHLEPTVDSTDLSCAWIDSSSLNTHRSEIAKLLNDGHLLQSSDRPHWNLLPSWKMDIIHSSHLSARFLRPTNNRIMWRWLRIIFFVVSSTEISLTTNSLTIFGFWYSIWPILFQFLRHLRRYEKSAASTADQLLSLWRISVVESASPCSKRNCCNVRESFAAFKKRR